jgi:PKD domain
MGSGRTADSRGRHLIRGIFVFVAIFATGLVTSGVVAGAGPLAVLADATTTETTTDTGTTGTDTTATMTTDSTETTTATDTTSTTQTNPVPAGPPTLASDRPDYAPGDTVTLTGDHWAPAEVVHIVVNDDQQKPWAYTADVVASATGTINHQFQLPTTFAATYTATATGPISGTASTTFTDGNVKFDTSVGGNGAQIVETLYSAAADCTGAVKSGFPKTDADGDDTVGVGNNESLRLDAAANANAPNASQAFQAWSSTDSPASPFTVIPGTNGRSICVPGFQSGTRNYRATYAANTAPTVDAGGPYSGGEGSNIPLDGASASDPSGPAPLSYLWTIDSASVGTGMCSLSNVTSLSSATINCTDNGSATVRLTATEAGPGLSSSDTASVTITNVAPTGTLGNSGPVNEGSSATVSFSGQTDPSSVDTSAGFHYAFACDNSSLAGATYAGSSTSASTTCGPFPDGPSSQTVRARIIDKDGGFTEYQTTIVVNNVAPTVSLSGANSADEGETKTYTYTVTDPGQDPNPTITEECGANGTYLNTPAANSFDCTFPDGPASSIVKVTANDNDPSNNIGSDSITVQVANKPPVVVLSGANSADEGETKTYTYTVTDPGQDPNPTITEECGANGTYLNTPAANSFDCTFTDGPNSIVKVTANDGDPSNNIGSDQITVAVGNRKPVVDVTSPSDGTLYEKGATVNVSASFSDPGTGDTHTCSINWDDGSITTGAVTEANGSGTCSGSHSFGGPGVYTIIVTVTDDEGASGSDTVMVVVYDPNGGFVTGGGWINSPAGAYRADPTLTGKANFGFVSKYKKGASAPEGQTEFQFQTGSLNFHSEWYQWLVVAGSKAQFKGTGTVNGGSGYGFLLTATDGQLNGGGGVDKFRIKIWRLDNSLVVYDNNFGASDDIDTANPQAIAGGSIVIHSGK